jgi:hypothetical protein
MPFLDWVNKTQALRTTADVLCDLLQFVAANGDSQSKMLIASFHG